MKSFKPVFLDTGEKFLKFFKAVQITAERALISDITLLCPMMICGSWFCMENKKKKKKVKQTPEYGKWLYGKWNWNFISFDRS